MWHHVSSTHGSILIGFNQFYFFLKKLTFDPFQLNPWVTNELFVFVLVLRMLQGSFIPSFSWIGESINLTFDPPYNLTPGSRMTFIVFFLCLGCYKDHSYRVSAQSMHVGDFIILTFDPYSLTPGSRMIFFLYFFSAQGVTKIIHTEFQLNPCMSANP